MFREKGVRSSRKIETHCHDDVAFRLLAANTAPDFRSIARFRARHLAAREALFMQALLLCQQAGMVRMGRVALDGTKVRANASRHKAMSYDRMCEREERLAAEVADMMGQAERVDAAEDAEHDLEQHARDQGAQHARTKARNAGHPSDAAEEAAGRAAETATPKAKPQRNFTDADSRIMKTADGSFHYCHNAQAVVDEANQVIVATDFADSGADHPAFADMLAQTHQHRDHARLRPWLMPGIQRSQHRRRTPGGYRSVHRDRAPGPRR